MTLKHKYNIPQMLMSVVGYKGIAFPGGFLPPRPTGDYKADDFEPNSEASERQELIKGTRLRKQDHRGIWYFMPVYFQHPQIQGSTDARESKTDHTIELQNAIISVTGKKNIVQTHLVGRKGSVKELINIDDYTIEIAAFIQSREGTYPDEQITRIKELYNINESVELISVLTDLIFEEDDRVVIRSIELPATPGVEDGQIVRIECVTDKSFELMME